MASRLAVALSLLFVGLVVFTPVYVEGRKVNVTFTLVKKVAFGRGFVVAGSVAALGNWSPASAPQMTVNTTTEVDWKVTVSLDLPVGTQVEFKPVKIDFGTGNNPEWFPGFNLVFTIPDADTLLVPINWPNFQLRSSTLVM